MLRLALGIFLASVALFFFGFLYWGISPLPYMAWTAPMDEPGAVEALKEHFPVRGTYYIPARDPDSKVMETKFQKGPLAFIFLLNPGGRSMLDEHIMIHGYLLSLVVLTLIALQLRQVSGALPTYLNRVTFVSTSGVIASVMIDGGDAIWWEMPVEWQLVRSGYHVLGWLIMGLILAKFVQSPKSATVAA